MGVKEKSFEFALDVIRLNKALIAEKEFIISKQLLRSATSVGANIAEANAGYSKKDFTYKMSIASKEASESHYWLRLLEASQQLPVEFNFLKGKASELTNLLTSIVKTCQERGY